MEASKETCVLAKIARASLQIIKGYVPKKGFHTVIFDLFFESLYRNWKENDIDVWGSGEASDISKNK